MNSAIIPYLKGQHVLTPDERRAAGKALRNIIPRSSHAAWSPAPDRPDPVGLLEESNSTRLASLVPIRYGRMLTSSFAFLRGSAAIMAHDLSQTPTTGLLVQACGDAHLSNFGLYATPERREVFDVNDFDETLPGPWEWDVKRLITSIVVAARHNSFPEAVSRQAALKGAQMYREHMGVYATMRHLDVWYSRVTVENVLKRVRPGDRATLSREIEKARRRTSVHIFPKLTTESKGQYTIKDDPPLIVHLDDGVLADTLRELVEGYVTPLSDDRQVLLSRYHVLDLAQKVVGVGSVGTRCYVVLLLGDDSNDPLFLQIKEAQASVLERYLGASHYSNHAQRVVCGQRLVQAASDIFLGWTRIGSTDYYIRQLHDRSLSPSIESMEARDFIAFAGLCGWVLARAHARSGDPAQMSSYLGRNDMFDQAVTSFAMTYANQVEQDYTALVAAVRSGRIPAQTEL
jgi:uncharacterized protein (DUF2252 family)